MFNIWLQQEVLVLTDLNEHLDFRKHRCYSHLELGMV